MVHESIRIRECCVKICRKDSRTHRICCKYLLPLLHCSENHFGTIQMLILVLKLKRMSSVFFTPIEIDLDSRNICAFKTFLCFTPLLLCCLRSKSCPHFLPSSFHAIFDFLSNEWISIRLHEYAKPCA